MSLYIGLLHYPVYNKNGEKITSAITNLDLHDLSRLARTFGVKRFFVINPLEDQQKLAESIIRHWKEGYGATYNIDRKEAVGVIEIAPSLEDAIDKIIKLEKEKPLLIATRASRNKDKAITYNRVRDILESGKTVFLLFGTAWGLHDEIIQTTDLVLEPIQGTGDYNHLSVRTAAGIILDRLFGRIE
jgi:hypothetical protein